MRSVRRDQGDEGHAARRDQRGLVARGHGRRAPIAQGPKREVIVNLNVESREALIRFAELLGEAVADLYFDGKLDLD